jgi:hypothetical protein
MTSTTDSLSESLDAEFAPAWKPSPGDKLTGVVADLSEREGYNGDPYPIVTIERDDGSRLAFHAFHGVARNELGRLQPRVGQGIGIKYEGKTKTADGKTTYHAYKIKTAGETAGVNWSKYAEADTSPAPNEDVPIDSGDLPEPDDTSDIPF